MKDRDRQLGVGLAALAAARFAPAGDIDVFVAALWALGGGEPAPAGMIEKKPLEVESEPFEARLFDPPETEHREPPGERGGDTEPPQRRQLGDGDALELQQFLRRAIALRGEESRWGQAGQAQRPIHFPLIAPSAFRAVLGALGRHPMPGQALDVPRLVDDVARRRSFRVLPRRRRFGLGKALVVVRDLGPGMMSFGADMDEFVRRAKRHLGAENVREDVVIDENGRILGLASVPVHSTVVVMSDLQGFAREYSYGHTRHEEWMELRRRLRSTDALALVLAPGSPSARVPQPAYADLFGGERPLLAPVLPWDNSLTARRAAAFARRKQRVLPQRGLPGRHEDAQNQAYRLLQGSAYRLLRLLAQVHDLDAPSLRTLRLVLSDPQAVLRGYRSEIEPGSDTKAWRASQTLSAIDAEAGALHEHLVWTSAYLEHRSAVASFSQRMDALRLVRRPSDEDPRWGETVAFAREALVRCRAGRGLTQLIGDAHRWADLPDRADREVAERERAEVRLIAEATARLDGSERRLAQIDRQWRRADSRVGVRGPHDQSPRLTLRRSGELLVVEENGAEADVGFPLEPGFDLQEGVIELWVTENSSKPERRQVTWPLPLRLRLERTDGPPLRTVVVRLSKLVYAIRLDADRSAVRPLFTRRIKPLQTASAGRTLRFVGSYLHFRGRVYDPVGLRDVGEAPAIAAPASIEETQGSSNLADGPLGLWFDGQQSLYAQRFADSGALNVLDLPQSHKESMRTAAGQDGHAMVLGWRAAWLVTARADAAQVTFWRQPTSLSGRVLTAASRAGGLVYQRLPDQSGRLHLFPAGETAAAQTVVSVGIEIDPDELAIGDGGRIAVRDGTTLHLFEPLAGLGQGVGKGLSANLKAAASAAPLEVATATEWVGHYHRRWLSTKDSAVAGVLEALTSEDDDSVGRLQRALKNGRAMPDAPQIEAFCKTPPGFAEAIAAVLAGDDASHLRSLDRAAFASGAVLSGSRLSPLHIACLAAEPADRVPTLIELGCDPNARDRFGRTPLFFAAGCNDLGATLSRLLDSGANPALCGEVRGTVLGPLARALWAEERPVPAAAIERLIAAGADALAAAGPDGYTALVCAAQRTDSDLFRRIRGLDPRVDHMPRDGFTPLRIAAYYGHAEIVRQLLEEEPRAPVDQVGPEGGTALFDAVRMGWPRCVALLLQGGANPDGVPAPPGATERNPLKTLIDGSTSPLAPERIEVIEAIARALAAAGAKPDCPPWPFAGILSRQTEATAAAIRGFAASGRNAGLIDTLRHERTESQALLTVDKLLELPLDLNARGEEGLHLVHLIASWASHETPEGGENLAAFEALATRGVTLDVVDAHGSTALHYAAAFGHLRATQALVRAMPALKQQRRADGLSAAELALLFGHTALAAQIEPRLAATPAPTTEMRPPRRVLARDSLLPADSAWQDVDDVAPVRRPAGTGGKPTVPLPGRINRWTRVLCRRSPLPYATPRWLQESWWRRDDGTFGVSCDVIDEQAALIFSVNGTSPPIHEMNGRVPPRLEKAGDVLAYLRFFCHAVHGKQGPFAICDSPEALLSHAEGAGSVDDEQWASLAPKASKAAQDDAGWNAAATVRYANTLFRADFRVLNTGMIEMIGDEQIPALKGVGTAATDGAIQFYEREPGGTLPTGHVLPS